MPNLSMERVDEWLHPGDGELTALATSQQEFDWLRVNAFAVRRDFAATAAHQAIAAQEDRLVPTPADDEAFFRRIPHKETLSRDLHRELAQHVTHRADGMSILYNEKLQMWNELAVKQTELDGFHMTNTKFDTSLYEDDNWYKGETAQEKFMRAWRRSNDLHDAGYPVRFLMRGAKYIQTAAVDLDTIREIVDFPTDFLGDRWNSRNVSYAYPQSSRPRFYHHKKYWLSFLQHYDQEMPSCAEQQFTFADSVKILGEGFYVAPYVPSEVADSGDYIDFDMVHAATLRTGKSLKVASNLFNRLADIAVRRHCPANTSSVKRAHLGAYSTLRSGIVFFARSSFASVAEELQYARNAKNHIAIADEVLAAESEPRSLEDELKSRLIHGWLIN